MNVYDFDHTIYCGDSTIDFWRYCLRRYPKSAMAFPMACIYGTAFKLHICSRERFKEQFYRFLCSVPDTVAVAGKFWSEHISNISEWYLRQKRADDLIISASPEFLIQPASDRLGVRCIASKVDPATGKLLGPNCRGAEKAQVFLEEYPKACIDEFYSDSKTDIYIARQAKKAFLVCNGTIKEWGV